DFEQFKTQTSEAHAKERYGMLMSEYDSIEGLLESHQKELYDLAQSRDLTREEVERLKYLNDELDKIRKQRSDKEAADFVTAFGMSKAHAQNLLDIEKKYDKLRADLGKSASKEQLEILNKGQEEEISAITLGEIHKSEIYRKAN